MNASRLSLSLCLSAALGLGAVAAVVPPSLAAETARPAAGPLPVGVTEVKQFKAPWAMTFLPDGRLLVTEMAGTLRLFDPSTGRAGTVAGVPAVAHGGQGGLGDVVLHPQFAANH